MQPCHVLEACTRAGRAATRSHPAGLQSVHDGCRAFLALLGPPDDILGLPLQSTSLGMLHFSRDIGILSLEGFLEVVEVVNSTLPFEAFQSPEIE